MVAGGFELAVTRGGDDVTGIEARLCRECPCRRFPIAVGLKDRGHLVGVSTTWLLVTM